MKIVHNQDGLVIELHEAGNANELHKKYFPHSEGIRFEDKCYVIPLIGKKDGMTLYFLVALVDEQKELDEIQLRESINVLKWRFK
jgi:hypothetical protein